VPKDWASNNNDLITGFIEDRISSAGMKFDNANFDGGKLNIQGSAPETVSFEK